MNKLTDEIFKPIIKNFERRSIVIPTPDLYWGADLVDVSNMKTKNKGFTFLLNVIDLSSRYAWSVPLKRKSKEDVLEAFKSIIDQTERHPDFLWVDEGTEFYNNQFKAYCKEINTKIYSTQSGLKSVFVERFNRTMKENFYKHLALHKTENYIDYLPEFMKKYNGTKHRATHETPYNLYFNDAVNHQKIPVASKHPEPKLKVGDFIRLSKVKIYLKKVIPPDTLTKYIK